MNSILKQDVVAALRSGKYKQGFGQLRSEEHCFCVFGVIADVLDPTLWEQADMGFWYHDGCGCALSSDICTRFDLRTEDWPSIEVRGGGWNSLMTLNDDGLTFPQLADLIEALA